MTPKELIQRLGLQPHPEGGHYVETWAAPVAEGENRPAGTAIYHLLGAGERSHWHRLDAPEIWHHYLGDALQLSVSNDAVEIDTFVLGPDLAAGQILQHLVPAGVWQTARSLGDWTLVGTTMTPGFSFDGFELAPPDWSPGQ